MQSKLPLLHSCPGGIRKSTFHGPWHPQSAAPRPLLQAEFMVIPQSQKNSHSAQTREINHLQRLKREDAGKDGLVHSLIREKAVEYPVPNDKSRIKLPPLLTCRPTNIHLFPPVAASASPFCLLTSDSLVLVPPSSAWLNSPLPPSK
jgi:hypothetical protein